MNKIILLPIVSMIALVGCKVSVSNNNNSNEESPEYENVSVAVVHSNSQQEIVTKTLNDSKNTNRNFDEIKGSVLCQGERAARNFKIKNNETIQIIKSKKCKYNFTYIKYTYESFIKTLTGNLFLDFDAQSIISTLSYASSNLSDKRNSVAIEAKKESNNKLQLIINEPKYNKDFIAQAATSVDRIVPSNINGETPISLVSVANDSAYNTQVATLINQENIEVSYLHYPLADVDKNIESLNFYFSMRKVPAGVKKFTTYSSNVPPSDYFSKLKLIETNFPTTKITNEDKFLFLLNESNEMLHIIPLESIDELRKIFNYTK